MKIKSLLLCLSIFIVFAFTGCNNVTALIGHHLKGYLSFTTTEYNNGINQDGGITTNFYCYDLETKKITKIKGIPYASGVYDRGENMLYFSAEVKDNKNGKGDQLFSYDLNTKKTKQLTNDIYAVNYIIPMKDKIATFSVQKGKQPMKVAYYDKKTGKFIYVNVKDDLNSELMSYNPFTGKLLVTSYYQKQMYDALDKANKEQKKIIMPDYYIYDYTDINKPKLLFTTKNMMINRIASNNQGDILYTQANDFSEHQPEYFSYLYNPKTSKSKLVENIASQLQLSRFLFYSDNKNQVFFIGVGSTNDQTYPRGIYSYDFGTKELKLIYTSKTGQIYDFTMLAS